MAEIRPDSDERRLRAQGQPPRGAIMTNEDRAARVIGPSTRRTTNRSDIW